MRSTVPVTGSPKSSRQCVDFSDGVLHDLIHPGPFPLKPLQRQPATHHEHSLPTFGESDGLDNFIESRTLLFHVPGLSTIEAAHNRPCDRLHITGTERLCFE